MIEGIPIASIGLGTGWAAFIALAFLVVRGFVKGDIVAGDIYKAALGAADKIAAQFERLQGTHAETTRQNTELLETARFTRAVTEAVDRKTRAEDPS